MRPNIPIITDTGLAPVDLVAWQAVGAAVGAAPTVLELAAGAGASSSSGSGEPGKKAEENGEADEGEENGEADECEENGMADEGEENGEADEGEENGVADKGEENGEADEGEEDGETEKCSCPRREGVPEGRREYTDGSFPGTQSQQDEVPPPNTEDCSSMLSGVASLGAGSFFAGSTISSAVRAIGAVLPVATSAARTTTVLSSFLPTTDQRLQHHEKELPRGSSSPLCEHSSSRRTTRSALPTRTSFCTTRARPHEGQFFAPALSRRKTSFAHHPRPAHTWDGSRDADLVNSANSFLGSDGTTDRAFQKAGLSESQFAKITENSDPNQVGDAIEQLIAKLRDADPNSKPLEQMIEERKVGGSFDGVLKNAPTEKSDSFFCSFHPGL